MANSTVFIIHGRDDQPVKEIGTFLTKQGLEVRSVSQLAAKYGGPASIKDVVAHGIKAADVILGLLTPDEAVALYEPSSGKLTEDSGWQPRPNVIFELGLALGTAPERLILASLGRVRPFTDLAGILFLDLAASDGKADLISAITSVLERAGKSGVLGKVDGDFSRFARERWPYYDELAHLTDRLSRIFIGKQRTSLLQIIVKTLDANPDENWEDAGQFETTAAKFMELLCLRFPGPGPLVSDSFWHLTIAGFFEHTDIHSWLDENDTWQGTSLLARISRRGFALIKKLQSAPVTSAPRSRPISRPTQRRHTWTSRELRRMKK